MSTELVVFNPTPDQIEEAKKKGAAWTKFGHDLALTNMSLTHQAAQYKPTLPTKVEDIVAAEQTLSALKKAYKTLQDTRKETTSKLDNVTSTLMLPEKAIEGYIKQVTDALLPLKRIEKQEAEKKEARAGVLRRFTEAIQMQYNELLGMCEKTILRIKTEKYEAALNNISIEYASMHVAMLKNEITSATFAIAPIKNEDSEKQSIIDRIYGAYDPQVFVDKFKQDIDAIFAGFAVAKANKTEALLNMQQQQAAAVRDINETTEVRNAGAGMDAVAITSPVMQTTKALKQFYVVDMPHNESSMVHIMRAFVTNMPLTMPTLRVADPFNIDINKMAQALANVKNNDNNFQPDKIIFVKTDKI